MLKFASRILQDKPTQQQHQKFYNSNNLRRRAQDSKPRRKHHRRPPIQLTPLPLKKKNITHIN